MFVLDRCRRGRVVGLLLLEGGQVVRKGLRVGVVRGQGVEGRIGCG